MSATAPRIIVAMDFADGEAAEALVRRLDPGTCRLKIGNELFTSAGPALLERWSALGFDVFLDLKYHDIPNTVAAACRAAADHGAWMINVHALGGRRMLEAARGALDGTANRPWLVAVTVLTSLADEELDEIGLPGGADVLAGRLGRLASDAGCDGVVCSAGEAAALRTAHGAGFLLVTPGIRPAGGGADDQRRTFTPGEARRAGSDYLVVGRPVTRADDPDAALAAIRADIGERP